MMKSPRTLKFTKILPIWLALFAVINVAFGELPELISRNVLFGNPEKLKPQISPDSKHLAYLAPFNGFQNIWVRTIGKDDDHPVSDDTNKGIRKYCWAMDSRRILFLQDNHGDENWRLYSLDIETLKEKARELTPFEGIQTKIVAKSKKIPEKILLEINKDNPEVHDLYILDINTGELKLDTKNPGAFTDWVANDSLEALAALDCTTQGTLNVVCRESVKNPWKTAIKLPVDEFVELSKIAGDYLYLYGYFGLNEAGLHKLNLKTTKVELAHKVDNKEIIDVFSDPDSSKPLAVKTDYLRGEWHVVDESVKADFQFLEKTIDGDFEVVSCDNDNQNWVIRYIIDDRPWLFYLYNRPRKKAEFMFSQRPKLEKLTLAKMKPLVIKSRDGLNLVSYLSLPPGLEPKNLPMVLLVHGGPENRDSWGCSTLVQMLANRGYAVLQVNFRGSAGFGKNFLNGSIREWAGKMHNDLIDGVNWAISEKIADKKKIAIVGGSFGGYEVLVGAAFTPDVFVCGVDEFGMANIFTHIKSIEPYKKLFLEILRHRIGDWDKEPEFIKSISPIFHVEKMKIPLLIGQGLKDVRVKPEESRQIVEALRKRGKKVVYIEFPDEGHGFRKPRNQLAFLAAMDKFLAEFLGGRYEPPSPEENEVLERLTNVNSFKPQNEE